MRKCLAALVLGVAASLTPVATPTAQAASPAAYHWCYYGSYSCYGSACSAARYLQQCGHCTKIVCYGSCYKVYYH